MLNVDWMQPFDHTPYSVGVLYLVLMNLPRNEYFKRQNIFLLGVIPGPNEPRNNINSFLTPLVDELMELWEEGVNLRHSGSLVIHERFRAALLCVACDMPTSKKVCGFTAHNSQNMVVINVPKNFKRVVLVRQLITLVLIPVIQGTL